MRRLKFSGSRPATELANGLAVETRLDYQVITRPQFGIRSDESTLGLIMQSRFSYSEARSPAFTSHHTRPQCRSQESQPDGTMAR